MYQMCWVHQVHSLMPWLPPSKPPLQPLPNPPPSGLASTFLWKYESWGKVTTALMGVHGPRLKISEFKCAIHATKRAGISKEHQISQFTSWSCSRRPWPLKIQGCRKLRPKKGTWGIFLLWNLTFDSMPCIGVILVQALDQLSFASHYKNLVSSRSSINLHRLERAPRSW